MKKIFTLLAATLFAGSMMAQVTTCASDPTVPAAQVVNVYSDAYPASGWGYCENWSQTTTLTQETCSAGNNILSYSNFNYLGWQGTPLDCSQMEYLHLDIYSATAGNINVYPIYGGTGLTTDDTHFKTLALVAGWNSFDLNLATDFAGLNLSSIFQFKFDQGVAAFSVDNVYFYTNSTPIVYTSLADVRNHAKGDTVLLKDFEVTYAPASDTRYYYIKDATAACVIYSKNYGLAAGDKVAKGMQAKVDIYNGLYEILPITAKADLTITAGTPAEPALAAAAPTVADQSKYVVYKNVRVAADTAFVSSSKNTVYGIMGNDTIMFYNSFKIAATLKADSVYNITAVNSVYNKPQVLPISIETVVPAVDECAGEHGLFNAATASINSTYLSPNWVADAGASAEISNGVITMHVNNAFVDMWNGQVFVDPGFTFEAGKMYHYEFDLVSSGKVCIFVKVNDSDADAFFAQAYYDLNLNGGTWHFSTDSVIANANLVTTKGPLVFGFGWTDANQDVIIKCIKITKMGDAPAPVEPHMYIKHPWGTGADADWTWKELAACTYKNVDAWTISDLWGGVGFNISDNAAGDNASWYAASDIMFLDSEGILLEAAPAVGTQANFYFVPSFVGSTVKAAYVETAPVTALDAINANNAVVKFFENGKMFIRRGEHVFDATGVMIK